ncbi:MAG: T9SS type A sorting domain-containing protein [Bacteroidales bacterium]|jgi:ligand-binding sensor domain-containing protein
MKKLLLIIAFICMTSFANAQWQITGLDSNHVMCLAINGNNIFAGTYEDGMYLSTNNGSSWSAINNGLTDSVILSLVIKGDSIFAGTGGGVFLSTNTGGNWTKMNNGLTDTIIDALAIKGDSIFAGTYSEGVFMSSNGGAHWNAANTGLPDSSHITSLFVSDSSIFAGTQKGIYITTNNGTNWDSSNTGIPTNGFAISFAKNGNDIFAGIPNRGIYLSSNAGSSWTAVNTGIYYLDLGIYTLITKGDTIFTGTNDNGSGVYFSSNNGNNWQAEGYGFSVWLNIYSLIIKGNYLFAGTEGGIWILPLSEVGIKELNNNESNIEVYPNPAIDNITIESPQKSTIEILNIQGQTILQQTLSQGKTIIDISTLAKGVYILRLLSNDKTEVTRIIKE